MRRLSAGLLLLAGLFPALFGACRAGDKRSPPRQDLAASWMLMSDEARAQLGAAVPAAAEVAGELARLSEAAQRAVGAKRGQAAVAALNDFLFVESGFKREVDDPDLRFMLLPYVVEKKRGSCLGLAGLYLALARKLDLPVSGVLVPGHFFLRLGAGQGHVNIELLRRGERMPDDWYRKKWKVPQKAKAFMRALTESETLAVVRFNLGNEYRTRGKYEQALLQYRQAVSDFPDFAEAYADMGLTYQLRRDYILAQKAYQRAAQLQPTLPGLEKNLAELRRQMQAAR
ncbi:MAG TPA: transglutaminase family protein [Myxococcota bacterium]|nr:transglutaminase family protein [Myxococcota bacterium]